MNKQELIERYLKMVKLKNIIKRINELEPSAKQYWIDEILKELGSDYGLMKYRSGYEQGKLEGMVEREKVKVPQFVADWIEYFKKTGDWDLFQAMDYLFGKKEIREWLEDKNNQETFARAWLDGYEVEKEKRYLVKIKGDIKENTLVYGEILERYFFTKGFTLGNAIYHHARKELEEAGFGWVFDCPGIEIEETEG